MNPILAAPAAVLGAMAVAPRVGDLVAAPGDFLSALRHAVGPEKTPAASVTSQAQVTADTPDGLRRRLESALQTLHGQLRARLAATGVDTTLPFSAELSTRGRVDLAGEHPDGEKLRRLLADDRELAQAANEIRQLAVALGRSDGRRLQLTYTPQRLTVA